MKLRTKVITMNVLITTVIILISGFIILKTVDNSNLYGMYQNLLSQSNFTEQYLSEFMRSKDNSGEILEKEKSSLEDILTMNMGSKVTIDGLSVNNPTELQKGALSGKKVYLINTTGSVRTFSLSLPIYSNEKIIGCVILENSLYQADMMKKTLLFTLLFISLTALLILFILSYLFSYRLIKPLEQLTLVTKEFSKGNFNEIKAIRTGDEIEGLTDSFNKMGRDIKLIIEDLKEEQKKQKKFLDNVTHEIRTPLTNIIGYADLSNRTKESEHLEKYLSYITGESNRLLGMVNDLLELSRLNTYEQAIIKNEVNLRNLIEQIINLMKDRARKYGFKIECVIEDLVVIADSEKLKQVIINLIDNAIKHSDGDHIIIRLWKADFIYISVSDNGMGIPKADIDNILQPFYRIDKSRSRKLGGSGLGLSICQEIVVAHGGSIKIESMIECGTTVTFSLQL
ncbi:HAMP domain-containing histidine kinase [Clostridium estertheticum]|uniref:sensor histidine kinase n=1 Tax=Clostridium estertheticum TaxID=238834 RepID=UPI0013E9307D|nr:HAMP domain-containing sensor histidine kinase [Clostridium estertheticum]MBZ9687107.1 HAMP domain-containing histidine kinase [Clostridium estertheticum]